MIPMPDVWYCEAMDSLAEEIASVPRLPIPSPMSPEQLVKKEIDPEKGIVETLTSIPRYATPLPFNDVAEYRLEWDGDSMKTSIRMAGLAPIFLPLASGRQCTSVPSPVSPSASYLAPNPTITTGMVRKRILISSQSDQVSMYFRSSRIHLSYPGSGQHWIFQTRFGALARVPVLSSLKVRAPASASTSRRLHR